MDVDDEDENVSFTFPRRIDENLSSLKMINNGQQWVPHPPISERIRGKTYYNGINVQFIRE